ncbi:MAG TPA: DedA family protein [Rhodopila sp.]|jgi:membrane protein DedA with SNARE-associated domain|nr:DedA family protein [Rhodopila sp.]
MWTWIDSLARLVVSNPAEALAIAFLASIIEAVAIIGTFLPGTFILMAVAGAAAVAGQSMVPFLLVAILGATLGDGLSFWVGRAFHDRIRSVWPFSRRPELLEYAEHFFRRYGMVSVALCRFIPVLRSNVPLFAGMANMKPRPFFVANIASALVWAPAHIYPAQLAGLSLDRIREGNWSGAALLGGVLLVCVVVAWAIHRWGSTERNGKGR